jgi:hypothetical protein
MIDVYPTRIEAVDEDKNVLFILDLQDANSCTFEIRHPMLLSNSNLEQALTAVRRGVQMLALED